MTMKKMKAGETAIVTKPGQVHGSPNKSWGRLLRTSYPALVLSLVVPSFATFVGSTWSSEAIAGELRSPTKVEQDKARKAGEARAKGYKAGKKGSPKDDGYQDMDPDTKEAYKKGYRRGQK